RAGPHRERERPVLPYRLAAAHEPAAGEIAGGEIVVTRDGHHGPPAPPRHVLDEARLAAAGGALEHDGEAAGVALLENGDLVRGREVARLPVEASQRGVIVIPGSEATLGMSLSLRGGAHAGPGIAGTGSSAAATAATGAIGACRKKSHRKTPTPAVKRIPVASSI